MSEETKSPKPRKYSAWKKSSSTAGPSEEAIQRALTFMQERQRAGPSAKRKTTEGEEEEGEEEEEKEEERFVPWPKGPAGPIKRPRFGMIKEQKTMTPSGLISRKYFVPLEPPTQRERIMSVARKAVRREKEGIIPRSISAPKAETVIRYRRPTPTSAPMPMPMPMPPIASSSSSSSFSSSSSSSSSVGAGAGAPRFVPPSSPPSPSPRYSAAVAAATPAALLTNYDYFYY